MKRLVTLIFAYIALGLAIIGVFLPLLPTVPFLLLAAWLAARSSQRLHQWLYSHRYFGKQLTNWEKHGAISRQSKITAVIMLTLSWALIFILYANMMVVLGLLLLFILVASFIVSRPEV